MRKNWSIGIHGLLNEIWLKFGFFRRNSSISNNNLYKNKNENKISKKQLIKLFEFGFSDLLTINSKNIILSKNNSKSIKILLKIMKNFISN